MPKTPYQCLYENSEARWHKLRSYLKKQADILPDGDAIKATVLQVIFTMDSMREVQPTSEDHE